MLKTTTSALLAFSFMCLCACNLTGIDANSTKYKNVSKEGVYKIMVPSFMDSTTKLHEEAGLQYANTFKELYLIVIKEKKAQLKALTLTNEAMANVFPDTNRLLGSYFTFIKSSLEKQPQYKLIDTIDKVIKQAPAKVGGIQLKLNELQVYYRIAAIEGKENLYQIYTWTLADRKDRYQPIMDSMINSLKEY